MRSGSTRPRWAIRPDSPPTPFCASTPPGSALRLWPLLTRRTVEIGSVTVDGLQADLLARRDGSDNWSFDVDEDAGDDSAGGTDSAADFSVASIELKNATLSYTDEADGSRYRIEQLDLAPGRSAAMRPFRLQASLQATDLGDNTRGTLRLSGLLSLAQTGVISTEELDTEIDVYASALPEGGMQAKLKLKNLAFDPDSSSGTVGVLTGTTELAGVALDLEGQGSFGKTSKLDGTLRIRPSHLAICLSRLETGIAGYRRPGRSEDAFRQQRLVLRGQGGRAQEAGPQAGRQPHHWRTVA